MNDYYKKHADEFIEDTFNCDMSMQYLMFKKYLPNKGSILDIGFGSGRDSIYFLNQGYEVYSIDPEEEFVRHAKEIGLKNVFKQKAEDMEFDNFFDGIWACASLLHISIDDISYVLSKCLKALKPNGVMYASFKYGSFEGIRNERYFLDMDDKKLNSILSNINFNVLETLITDDVRKDRTEKWFNVILKKNR